MAISQKNRLAQFHICNAKSQRNKSTIDGLWNYIDIDINSCSLYEKAVSPAAELTEEAFIWSNLINNALTRNLDKQ